MIQDPKGFADYMISNCLSSITIPTTDIKNKDTFIMLSVKVLVDHLKHIHSVKIIQ